MRLALGTVQFGLDYGISNLDGQVSDGELDAIIALARQTRRIIRENLAWALLYNLVALPFAAAGAPPMRSRR